MTSNCLLFYKVKWMSNKANIATGIQVSYNRIKHFIPRKLHNIIIKEDHWSSSSNKSMQYTFCWYGESMLMKTLAERSNVKGGLCCKWSGWFEHNKTNSPPGPSMVVTTDTWLTVTQHGLFTNYSYSWQVSYRTTAPLKWHKSFNVKTNWRKLLKVHNMYILLT